MRNTLFYFLLVVVTFSTPRFAEGQESLSVLSDQTYYPGTISYFFEADRDANYSISDITSLDDKNFHKLDSKILNERASYNPIWVKFDIENNLGEELYLDIGNTFYTWNAEIYMVDSDGNVSETESAGTFVDINKHKVFNHFVVPLDINSGQRYSIYIKYTSESPRIHVLRVGTLKALIKELRFEEYAFGGILALISGMFLYNLFLYFSIKDRIYLYYLFHLITALLNISFINGHSLFEDPWFWEHPYAWVAFGYLSVTLFTDKYLQLKANARKLRIAIWTITGILFLLVPVMTLFGVMDRITLKSIWHLFTIVYSLLILATGVYLWIRGYKVARFYVLGWSATLASLIAFILLLQGVLPINNFTLYSTFFGVSLEVILFAFALGDNINLLKQEHEEAQQKNLALMTSYNEELEKRVAEKSRALQLSQQQLINSEKMASLGMMAGGISHEINNPLNIIQGGVFYFKNNIDEAGGEPTEDDKEVIESMNSSIQRVAHIVKALNVYNRYNEFTYSSCDLHYILDASLSLFADKMENVMVIKNFDKDSKLIRSDEGKLHQVFMNIYSNCLDAINYDGKIEISTKFEANEISISIMDNGTGIPQKVMKNIFDPFFTTKETGKGTGLGLSITQNLVIELGGSIKVNSEEGVGAEVVIQLFQPEYIQVEVVK